MEMFFIVSLNDSNISKDTLEKEINKLKAFQSTFNTKVTVTLSDISKAKDQKEKDLFGLLERTQREQSGSYTTELDWHKADIVVYTQTISIGNYGDINQSSEFGSQPIYCQLAVPMTSELPDLELDELFPKTFDST